MMFITALQDRGFGVSLKLLSDAVLLNSPAIWCYRVELVASILCTG